MSYYEFLIGHPSAFMVLFRCLLEIDFVGQIRCRSFVHDNQSWLSILKMFYGCPFHGSVQELVSFSFMTLLFKIVVSEFTPTF